MNPTFWDIFRAFSFWHFSLWKHKKKSVFESTLSEGQHQNKLHTPIVCNISSRLTCFAWKFGEFFDFYTHSKLLFFHVKIQKFNLWWREYSLSEGQHQNKLRTPIVCIVSSRLTCFASKSSESFDFYTHSNSSLWHIFTRNYQKLQSLITAVLSCWEYEAK